jgi:hypothetical protein
VRCGEGYLVLEKQQMKQVKQAHLPLPACLILHPNAVALLRACWSACGVCCCDTFTQGWVSLRLDGLQLNYTQQPSLAGINQPPCAQVGLKPPALPTVHKSFKDWCNVLCWLHTWCLMLPLLLAVAADASVGARLWGMLRRQCNTHRCKRQHRHCHK